MEEPSAVRGEGSLAAWITGIARHKVEDYYRRCLRGQDSLEAADGEDQLPDQSFDLRGIVEQEELQNETLRVIDSLPERYRLVLIWRYWDRESTHDMAVKTGKTEKAIERLLARARAEFRQRWTGGQAV